MKQTVATDTITAHSHQMMFCEASQRFPAFPEQMLPGRTHLQATVAATIELGSSPNHWCGSSEKASSGTSLRAVRHSDTNLVSGNTLLN
jgi:hypothetical protein